MTTANARTNEQGQMLNATGDFHASPVNIYANKKNPWKVQIEFKEKGILQQILGKKAFTLLAHHLLNSEGYSPMAKVAYGRSGMTRAIKIGRKEYRSNAYSIYSPRGE